MKDFFLKNTFAGLSIILMSFLLPAKRQTKVYLIGDSTIANKEVKAYPETGWGMPFTYFFDSSISVDNRAKNGRSTKSFIAENLCSPWSITLMKVIMYSFNLAIMTRDRESQVEILHLMNLK